MLRYSVWLRTPLKVGIFLSLILVSKVWLLTLQYLFQLQSSFSNLDHETELLSIHNFQCRGFFADAITSISNFLMVRKYLIFTPNFVFFHVFFVFTNIFLLSSLVVMVRKNF